MLMRAQVGYIILSFLGKFEAVQLTSDHSCDVDREQRRILEYGGRVSYCPVSLNGPNRNSDKSPSSKELFIIYI